jgi:hypothetical protein
MTYRPGSAKGVWRPTWRTHRVVSALADGEWMTLMQVWRAGPGQAGVSYAATRDVLWRLYEHGFAENELVHRIARRGMRWRATPSGIVWGLQARKRLPACEVGDTVAGGPGDHGEHVTGTAGDVMTVDRESAGLT